MPGQDLSGCWRGRELYVCDNVLSVIELRTYLIVGWVKSQMYLMMYSVSELFVGVFVNSFRESQCS